MLWPQLVLIQRHAIFRPRSPSNFLDIQVRVIPIFKLSKTFLRLPTAGIISWILIILGNIGIMIWLGTAKGVTTIQSSYAALSGPEYVAYWNLYYQVSDLYVKFAHSVRSVIPLAAVYE